MKFLHIVFSSNCGYVWSSNINGQYKDAIHTLENRDSILLQWVRYNCMH